MSLWLQGWHQLRSNCVKSRIRLPRTRIAQNCLYVPVTTSITDSYCSKLLTFTCYNKYYGLVLLRIAYIYLLQQVLQIRIAKNCLHLPVTTSITDSYCSELLRCTCYNNMYLLQQVLSTRIAQNCLYVPLIVARTGDGWCFYSHRFYVTVISQSLYHVYCVHRVDYIF